MKGCDLAQVFGLIIVLIVAVAGAEDSCKERCCSDNNSNNNSNIISMVSNTTKIKNTSSCIEKCLESQGSERRKFSERNLCRNETELAVGKSPTRNSTKKSCIEILQSGTNDFIAVPERIRIKFYTDVNTRNITYHYANITWKPLNITDKSKNWTHYFILWISGEIKPLHCGLVPKDQTFFVINSSSDSYKYPNRIEFNVFTYPVTSDPNERYALDEGGRPKMANYMIPITLPSEPVISSLSMAAIIVGTCVGIALVVAVAVAVKLNVRLNNIWNVFPRIPPNHTIVEEPSQVYLSYYQEDNRFMDVVIPLVQGLTNVGYNVIMNKMYTIEQLDEGQDRWAQHQIAKSSKVIVLCSPSYIEICQQGASAVIDSGRDSEHNRVWFEVQLLSTIYAQNKSASKIICVWMNKGVPNGLPPWMGVRYTWPQDHKKIINRLKSRNNRWSLTRELISTTSDNQRSYSLSVTDGDDDVFDDRLPDQQVA